MIDALRQRQFLVFLAGGLLCAGVDVGAMQLLLAAGGHHTAAASAGFAAGLSLPLVAFNGYLLGKYWIFK